MLVLLDEGLVMTHWWWWACVLVEGACMVGDDFVLCGHCLIGAVLAGVIAEGQ